MPSLHLGILVVVVEVAMHVDLQKRFPILPCVSQMLGGPSLWRGDTNEGLSIPSGIGCAGKDIG